MAELLVKADLKVQGSGIWIGLVNGAEFWQRSFSPSHGIPLFAVESCARASTSLLCWSVSEVNSIPEGLLTPPFPPIFIGFQGSSPTLLSWLMTWHLGFSRACLLEVALTLILRNKIKRFYYHGKNFFFSFFSHTIFFFIVFTWTVNFQMFKLVLEKAEEPEIKLPASAGSSKKQESSKKTSISALLTMPKPLTVWITRNCGKFLNRQEYQTTWPASWETCMQVRKQQLELDKEQQTGSK